MSTGTTPPACAMDRAAHFELDDDDITLLCPGCDECLWLDAGEYPTLGDIVKAASAHKCESADG